MKNQRRISDTLGKQEKYAERKVDIKGDWQVLCVCVCTCEL